MPFSLEHYLDSADGTAQVMTHARLLLKLSRRYESIAPAGLSHVSRVANYKSGKIVIHADNGAIAAKLRQMSTSICQRITQTGIECNVMEIKVQPRENPYQSIASTPKPLSATSSATLRATSSALPETSPLRQALEQLLSRAALREDR